MELFDVFKSKDVKEETIGSAMAEEYFEKFKSMAKEDNVEAFIYLQKAADLWHKEAVKRVVSLYRSGFCKECFRRSALKVAANEWKNTEKGIAYGLEAEKHGIDVAWELMLAYEGIEIYEQALHWAKISDSRAEKAEAVQKLTKQAEQWYEEGLSYYKEKNYAEALALWKKSGQLGHVDAQYICGLMYSGRDGSENKMITLYWFKKAAEQGHAEAAEALNRFHESQRKDADNPDFLYNAGMWYYGKDAIDDKLTGLYMLEKAAEQGHADAQYYCGTKYDLGIYTEVNHEKALCWYEKAAEQGHADAQIRCGWMYNLGKGTKKNRAKALYWSEKAAEQGDADIQFQCGVIYLDGENKTADIQKAYYWIKKAAEQGHGDAQAALLQF